MTRRYIKPRRLTNKGETAVSGGFARFDTQFTGKVVDDPLGAHERAGDVAADLDDVRAHRVAVEHGVPGGRFFDLHGRKAQVVGDEDGVALTKALLLVQHDP